MCKLSMPVAVRRKPHVDRTYCLKIRFNYSCKMGDSVKEGMEEAIKRQGDTVRKLKAEKAPKEQALTKYL